MFDFLFQDVTGPRTIQKGRNEKESKLENGVRERERDTTAERERKREKVGKRERDPFHFLGCDGVDRSKSNNKREERKGRK